MSTAENLSKYEQFLQKSKEDGTASNFDSAEDKAILRSISEISLEIKRDYEIKDAKSIEYASQLVIR